MDTTIITVLCLRAQRPFLSPHHCRSGPLVRGESIYRFMRLVLFASQNQPDGHACRPRAGAPCGGQRADWRPIKVKHKTLLVSFLACFLCLFFSWFLSSPINCTHACLSPRYEYHNQTHNVVAFFFFNHYCSSMN